MSVNEALSSLSTTAASNTPSGSTSIGTNLDDHLRDIKKNIRYASNIPVQAAKTTAYTVVATDHNTLLQVDATASAVTVTLLAAATAGDGFRLGIKKLDSTNNVTIDGNASETVDGSVTAALTTQYQSVFLTCDGSNWHIEAEHDPTSYQASDAELSAIAALATTDGNIMVGDGSTWVAESGATARTSLGAQQDVITTRGDIVRGSSSGAAERLAVGTSGQVLTSDGTDISWGSAGDLVKITSKTASASTTIDFGGNLTTTYQYFILQLTAVAPATDGVDLWARFSQDGGSTYLSTAGDYSWAVGGPRVDTGGFQAGNDTSDTEIQLNVSGLGNAAGETIDITITIPRPAQSDSAHKTIYWQGRERGSVVSNQQGRPIQGSGSLEVNTSPIDSIQFRMSSGNIASGEFVLWGVK